MKAYKLLREHIDKSGLLSGVTVQYLNWVEDDKSETYAIFRPNGGSLLKSDLSNEYFVLLDLIGTVNNPQSLDDLTTNIANYITTTSTSNNIGCIGVIGAIPTPIITSDNRVIYRLNISVKQ